MAQVVDDIAEVRGVLVDEDGAMGVVRHVGGASGEKLEEVGLVVVAAARVFGDLGGECGAARLKCGAAFLNIKGTSLIWCVLSYQTFFTYVTLRHMGV